MNQNEILANTDRTSWPRIAMVWRFYLPRFRPVIWSYSLASLLIFAISVVAVNFFGVYGVLPLSVLNYMVILSPLAFTPRHNSTITASLPALGLEKCIVIFGFSFIIVPALAMLPAQLAEYVSGIDLGKQVPDYVTDSPGGRLLFMQSTLATIAQIAACLLAVTVARQRLTLCGILAVFGVSIFVGLFEIICGVIAAICDNVPALNENTPPMPLSELVELHQTQVLIVSMVILLIFTIFAIWKTAHAICRRQY